MDYPAAKTLFDTHLTMNRLRYVILTQQDHDLQVIEQCAGIEEVSKCLDERKQGSKNRGTNNTRLRNHRSRGNIIDTSEANLDWWTSIYGVRDLAKVFTPDKPARYSSNAHYSKKGPPCAAHHGDTDAAIASARLQAQAVAERFSRHDVFATFEVSNTDDGSIKKMLPDGRTIVDTNEVIAELHLSDQPLQFSSDVFSSAFLDARIGEQWTHTQHQTVRELLSGSMDFFNNLPTEISMQRIMLETLCRRNRGDEILNPRLYKHLMALFNRTELKIPGGLKNPLLHQFAWNTAWALYQRVFVEQLTEEKRELYLGHGAGLAAVGRDFVTGERNEFLLATIDDMESLQVEHDVLTHFREKHPQEHPIAVHINHRIDNRRSDYFTYVTEVWPRLKAKEEMVKKVFGNSICLLMSYSYGDQHLFYPVIPDLGDNGIAWRYPGNVLSGVEQGHNFYKSLAAKEWVYAHIGQCSRVD